MERVRSTMRSDKARVSQKAWFVSTTAFGLFAYQPGGQMLVNRLALRYEPLTQTHSVKDILAEKDAELRQKQREIDRLYGKLATASPLTDAELRQTLAKALQRLVQEERQGL